MAVNGFLVNNEVQKYNYESLENYNTPDFSTSSTYQVGDYVMYQGKLYRCTTEIITSGGWDSSKWSLAILSDDVADLKNSVESGEYGLSESVKQAILQIARKVAYIDDQGQIYYNALYNAFYPPIDLSSITAVYTQSGTVYDTDTLDSLKADLVVTAYYSDSSTQIVSTTDYTLSGTLSVGISTITVSYGGKTTTFTVTVTHDDSADWDYIWKYTDGLPPASDWSYAASGGSSGFIKSIANDGMLMGSKYGTSSTYKMDYAASSILSAGGGIAEFAFYIPSGVAVGVANNFYFFSISIGNGTNGVRVKFAHPKQTTQLNICLEDDSSAWYGGTVIRTFEFDTPYIVRLEMDNETMTGRVYINGTLEKDDIDLNTVNGANYVQMYTGGATVNSTNAALAIVIQSVKVKYGKPESVEATS